jgi:hypothetical protein
VLLKKIVCNDRSIALKLKAEKINILIVHLYMPTSVYEDEESEELHDIIEEILEDYEKGETSTIIIGHWDNVVGGKSYRNIVGPEGLGRRDKWGPIFFDFCEKTDLFSPTHGLKRLREDCTAGKYQQIEIDISWTTSL